MEKIKWLLLFFIILLFISCTPIIETITDYIYIENPDIDPETLNEDLFGTWVKDSSAWDFYDNGEFIYYDYFTLEVHNYGFYIIDDDTIYLEDYFNFESALYTFLVMENYPVFGTITLRWDIGDYEKVIDEGL